jgi:DNA-binding NtrC family response regulator
VIPIRLPSLRERTEDIPLLAQHFLERVAARTGRRFDGFSDEAVGWLLKHRWPGNVRELENVVERAATLARGLLVTLADLSTEFVSPQGTEPALRPTLNELESQYIRRVLAETKGDKVAAAKILGISVRTLQRRFKDV